MNSLFYTYIMTNKHHTVMYVGFTNNLERRVAEHRNGTTPGFTAKYRVKQLVWYETFSNPNDGIAAEKRIKHWRIEKKVALIRSTNPKFEDLSILYKEKLNDERFLTRYCGFEMTDTSSDNPDSRRDG
jgi:putative endonuclease